MEQGFNVQAWQTFADLGWTAIPFAEDDGGLGGGPIELALLMQQFGRGLVVEPFLLAILQKKKFELLHLNGLTLMPI